MGFPEAQGVLKRPLKSREIRVRHLGASENPIRLLFAYMGF